MRVLFISNVITPYFSAVLSKLGEMGVDITIVVSDSKINNAVGGGVKTTEHASFFKIRYEKVVKAWYGKDKYKNLKQIIQQESPDILVFIWPYFLHLYFDRSIIRYIKSKGIKWMIREIPFQIPPYGELSYFNDHPVYDEEMNITSNSLGFKLRAWITMQIRRYLYSRVDGTLNYASAAKDILPGYGVKEELIHVTYNSSDTDALIKEKSRIKDTPLLLPVKQRIIHIGRLVKWKRVDLLIDAFSIVLHDVQEAELLIVGDGPELNNLKQQAVSLGIEHAVRFVGAIYDSYTLGKYMSESSIYVLAGMGGLSINDAMTYGLPVICSVCDGTEKDLIEDGGNGYFFKEGDKHDLANKILSLLKDKKSLIAFGKKSEEIINNKININIVAKRFYKAFDSINK